jgi:hypothetical protein
LALNVVVLLVSSVDCTLVSPHLYFGILRISLQVYFDIFVIVGIFDTCEYTCVKLLTTLANALSKVCVWKYAARAQKLGWAGPSRR